MMGKKVYISLKKRFFLHWSMFAMLFGAVMLALSQAPGLVHAQDAGSYRVFLPLALVSGDDSSVARPGSPVSSGGEETVLVGGPSSLMYLADVASGFDPAEDGYRFADWGEHPDNEQEFTFADLRRMFGDEAVFQRDGAEYVPDPAAIVWLERVNELLKGGHCDGFTTTALRFFIGLDDPATFQKGATMPNDLSFDSVYRHITYYWVLQVSNPVAITQARSVQKTPVEVLAQVHEAIANDAIEPTTLILFNRELTVGHSVTPYRVEQQDDDMYRIYVYDGSYPNDTMRYVEVNVTENTWRYQKRGKRMWDGDATSHTLGAVPLSTYSQPPECSWCKQSSALQGEDELPRVQTWATGSRNLVITDAQGRRVGYRDGERINEIPQALRSLLPAALDASSQVVYHLPVSSHYTLLLEGQDGEEGEHDGSITQAGPGYVVGVDQVSLAPTVSERLVVAEGGTEITYTAGVAQDVDLTVALNGSGNDASYHGVFEVQDVAMQPGQSIALKIDGVHNRLVVTSEHGAEMTYTLMIDRVGDAEGERFQSDPIVLRAEERHVFDYTGLVQGNGSVVVDF
jgi:hypothetical protein